jgi:ribosomal-protein-alanine N-acetyltransferase
MRVEIRLAGEKDLTAVEEIEKKSFSEPWIKLSFQECLDDPGCLFLVADEGKEVLGYAIGWIVLDELHIGNLAVHPQRRGEGIGGKLLSSIIGQVARKGCKMASLELRESNQIALYLYAKKGFKPVAVKRNYYRHPREDAIVMIKEFEDGMV